MNIYERLKIVQQAELEAKERAQRARDAWKALKHDASEGATPWRIVGVGAVAGFLVGRRGAGTPGAGIGSRLFGSISQAVITALGAGATAGAAASTAADAAAAATVDATIPPPAADAGVSTAQVGAALAASAVAGSDADEGEDAEALLDGATAPEPALFADSSRD